MDLRKNYSSKDLDNIFVFFMKSYLRGIKTGLLSLKADIALENDKDKLVQKYVELAIELVIASHPPEIINIVLESEYAEALKKQPEKKQILEMNIIKALTVKSLQAFNMDALLNYSNFWSNEDIANAYYCQTLLPNMPYEFIEKEGMLEIMKHMPDEMKKINDY